MANTVTESILLGILSFFGGSSFGMSALGVALIFEIGYFLLGSMRIFTSETLTKANVYLTIAILPMTLIEAPYLRKHWNIPFALIFGISTACFTIIGIFVLENNDTIWLARALGIFLLISFIILCYIQYKKYKQNQQLAAFSALDGHSPNIDNENDSVLNLVERTSSNDSITENRSSMQDNDGIEWKIDSLLRVLVLIILGIISGLLRGLWGVAGVPIMFFALLTNINKDEFRASVAFAMILSESVSVVQLLIINKNLEQNEMPQYIVILIAGFIGLMIGNHLSPYLNQQSFHILIMYLIFSGAIILTTRGFVSHATDLIVSLLLIIIGTVLFCYWLYHSCKNNKKSQDKLPIHLESL